MMERNTLSNENEDTKFIIIENHRAEDRSYWCEGGSGGLKETKVGREEKENRDAFPEVSS